MKLLAVADDVEATITTIRLREPLQALCAAEGWRLAWRPTHECTRADLHAADVLVLQRGIGERAYRLQQRMQASGGRVVFEIDDLLTAAPAHALHRQALDAGRPWLERALSEADAVSASTARLADALRPLARRVELAPNYAPVDAPRAAPRNEALPATLLFAASDRVAAEFVAPALAAAAAQRPGRLRAVAIGPLDLALEASGIPVERHPALARDRFLAFVASLANAVAVIPLDASPFSACKSAIKFFDYAAIGVPVLCSRLPPYADVVVDGRTGTLVDNSAEAWASALMQALDDPARLQMMADAARADVAERFSLGHAVTAWRRLLLSLGPRSGPVRAPGPWAGLSDRLVATLRAANRARLAARRRR